MDLPTYTVLVISFGAAVGILLLIKNYMSGGRFSGKERIPGKTVIVTGANTGIGKETAKELARRGARVILACRNLKKAGHAKAEIVSETSNENVVVKHLDLASMKSIHAFAEDINASEPHIDILINNAGVFMYQKSLTEDGFEMQLGVNHLGPFLLTMLLLDKLKSSAPSRIINVSSVAHGYGDMNFDDLNSEKSPVIAAYGQSKLANVLFTRELAKRLENTGVTVNAVHPGVIDTQLLRCMPIVSSNVFKVLLAPATWLLIKTPKQGAQTSIYCAVSAELEGVTGLYFKDCRQAEVKKQAKDDEAAKRLWNISEKWTKLA